ncbi:hypothetical protein CEXT_698611 [Caerostris extrusa]|uniref:Uncharacterized protein n=1 Tax=Caerostris extrusa TaxID=172846 RepID=A0AAV4SWR5_CAEEX|nr:hypothetical protein CEXT_698611 [Caerostris extrusa]
MRKAVVKGIGELIEQHVIIRGEEGTPIRDLIGIARSEALGLTPFRTKSQHLIWQEGRHKGREGGVVRMSSFVLFYRWLSYSKECRSWKCIAYYRSCVKFNLQSFDDEGGWMKSEC